MAIPGYKANFIQVVHNKFIVQKHINQQMCMYGQ